MNLDLNLTKPGQIKNDYLDVKMAAWTPGSYLMREYAKNLEAFSAKRANGALKRKKISKNTWSLIKGLPGLQNLPRWRFIKNL